MARWRLLEPEADIVSELSRVARIDPLCARVLANRGLTPEAAPGFLSPSLKTISAPEEEPWRVAARRIAQAIKNGERIGVFGDYDTDGITSAAVLCLGLSRYTSNLIVKLPTRQTGYGLLEPYVRDLFAEGVDLVVTADCGISNRAEVELAKSLGMDVIVTDHHIPPEAPPEAPPAVAVLDPKLWDPKDALAGVGVAWKLAWAVARRPGLAALVKVAGVRGDVDEGDLGWKIGPRLNSIGRIKHPRPALDLLLTEDRREALRIASHLNQLNSERQQRTRRAVERAMAEVNPQEDFKVVVTDEGSAGGLAGLVAGRIAGATGRPAAILNRRIDGSYGGSARAGETDVDLYGALFSVRHLLGEWGGHRKAAGLSVEPGNFDAFVSGVNEAVRAQVGENPEVFEPPIEIDAEVSLESLSNGLLDWHERLAPFGSGNYRPVFLSEGLRVEGSRQLWDGMNLLRLKGGVSAKLAGSMETVPERAFDAAYAVSRNAYTGGVELE
ncbi:MAG: DHH family phosphoesterase, partial [Actinobacteria bacterium]|nr:DHH family phosphoesterase [Actinomycetota bacterium]